MTLTEAQQLRAGDLVLVMSSATQLTPATVREIRLAGKATRIDVRYQNGKDGSVPLQRVRARPARPYEPPAVLESRDATDADLETVRR